jgi:hypothetical protein
MTSPTAWRMRCGRISRFEAAGDRKALGRGGRSVRQPASQRRKVAEHEQYEANHREDRVDKQRKKKGTERAEEADLHRRAGPECHSLPR